jgi:hypothetical protein
MSELLDLLEDRLDPSTLNAMSRRIGADEQQTEQAVAMLLPALIGGLARNTRDPGEGRVSLDRALARDHDGGLLDALGGMFGGASAAPRDPYGGARERSGGLLEALGGLLGGGPGVGSARTTDADGILGHILGGRRSDLERGVGRATGLGSGSVTQLLAMLAPMVMGALGRSKRERHLDADGVADILARERRSIEERTPEMGEGGLMDLLDSNRDGRLSMADDVAKVGATLGAAWLATRGRRRKS